MTKVNQLMVIAIVLASFIVGYSQASVIHRYAFETNGSDSVGNAHLTAVGNVTHGYEAGGIGGYVSFDGATDIAYIADVALGSTFGLFGDYTTSGTDLRPFTVSAWVRLVEGTVGIKAALALGTKGTGAEDYVGEPFRHTGMFLHASVGASPGGNLPSVTVRGAGASDFLYGTAVNDGQWHHLVGVFGRTYRKFIIDGQYEWVSNVDMPITSPEPISMLTVGGFWRNVNGGQYVDRLPGDIGDLQFYTEAFTFEQAEYLYNNPDLTVNYAVSPSPANNATDLGSNQTLSWQKGNDPAAGQTITGYYLYGDFYTTPGDMQLIATLGVTDTDYGNQVGEELNLTSNSTYQWRVDQAVNGSSASSPETIPGTLWTFSTLNFVPQVISIQPLQAEYKVGKEVVITATYDSGQSAVTAVTWYLHGVALDPQSDSNIDVQFTQTESVLTIAEMSGAYEGDYYCIVSNSQGDSAPSDISVVDYVVPWIWTGGAGTSSWAAGANWDAGTAPGQYNDAFIGGSAIVGFDLSANFQRGADTLLRDNAQLTLPQGSRFINSSGGRCDFYMSDNSELNTYANYFIVSQSSLGGTFNQSGGVVNADIDRGFFTSDGAGRGQYNILGGVLNLNYLIDPTQANADWWGRFLGNKNDDLFLVDGGEFIITNNSSPNRNIHFMRNSLFDVQSGSVDVYGINTLNVGYEFTGLATLNISGGVFNLEGGSGGGLVVGGLNTNGLITIDGGLLSVAHGGAERYGIRIGLDNGSGAVEQSGGSVELPNLAIEMQSFMENPPASYTISGGSLEAGKLVMNPDSVFCIVGSKADYIKIQEFTVNSTPGDSVVLSLELDDLGTTLIEVGLNPNDPNGFNSGVVLTNLEIEVDTIIGFSSTVGDTFDILWAANHGIIGEEAISLTNTGAVDFEVSVVDATTRGYASGEMLILTVLPFDPSRADLNEDGVVDLADLMLFSGVWLWDEAAGL